MAYIQQDYTYPGSMDVQTEEELKRREEERLRQEEQQRLQQLQQTNMPSMPVAGPVNPQDLQMPQPGPGVQVASNQNVPGMVPQQTQQAPQVPVNPSSLYSMPSTGGGQGLQLPQGMAPSPAEQTVIGQEPSNKVTEQLHPAIDRYHSLQDNPKLLLNFANDKNEPEWLRERARNTATDLLVNNREKQKAEASIKNMDSNQLAQALREKTTGGSWTKAIIYNLLGMDQSAQAEAAKLGIGKETVMQGPNGESYMVKLAANGTPIEGYDASTGMKLTSNELVNAVSMVGNKLNIVGGSYINDKTGEVGRMVTDEKTGRTYIQTDTGRKPMSGFRPQSSMGSLDTMRQRTIQELNLKLQGKGIEEQMAILRPYNQHLVEQGIPPVQPNEVGIRVPQIGGNAGKVAPQPAAAPQPAPQAAPAAVSNKPPVPASVLNNIQTTSQPSQTNLLPAGNPTLTYKPPIGQGLGGRPTGPQLEAEKTRQKEQAQEVGTDLGKLQVNQPKAEANADYLVTKIDELVKHPGFETSVGLKGPSLGFGLWNPPPGTDAADWAQRFKEVQGGAFTQAVETMRGLGALSNQEGESATKAIQRMSQSQSEKEFKQAAKDFQDVIQRGIDRNRIKLGQEPKYGTPAASETGKTNEIKIIKREKIQ